jgi:hypothetical protein
MEPTSTRPLSEKQTELKNGDWRDPEAGAVNFKVYADKWVEDRELGTLTSDLYRYLLGGILPTFGGDDLDEITSPRVRAWRTERLQTTGAKTAIDKAYRLSRASWKRPSTTN